MGRRSLQFPHLHVAHLVPTTLQEYYYELFLDDLPVWGFVGEMAEDVELFMGGAYRSC